jgi:uncharacterized membrane protein YdcZ (DUF606 family)
LVIACRRKSFSLSDKPGSIIPIAMNSRTARRKKNGDWVLILTVIVVTTAMVLAPILLGHHMMGMLPLSAGLLYGLVLPLAILFMVCLVKFSWEARIIMIVCVGGLFLLSIPVMKKAS